MILVILSGAKDLKIRCCSEVGDPSPSMRLGMTTGDIAA